MCDLIPQTPQHPHTNTDVSALLVADMFQSVFIRLQPNRNVDVNLTRKLNHSSKTGKTCFHFQTKQKNQSNLYIYFFFNLNLCLLKNPCSLSALQ